MTMKASSTLKLYSQKAGYILGILMLIFLVYDRVSGTGAAKAELKHNVQDNMQDIEVLKTDMKETKTVLQQQTLILQRLDINVQYFMKSKGVRYQE